jgi:hypothetical protein
MLSHILEERVVSSKGRTNHRAIKRHQSQFPRKKRMWPKRIYKPAINIIHKVAK